METLTVRIANDGTLIPVEDINLNELTNVQLIQAIIDSGEIPAPAHGHEYRLTNKKNEILTEEIILKKAGFEDGDTITLIDKGAAAYWDPENDPADNESEDNGSCDESPSGAAG